MFNHKERDLQNVNDETRTWVFDARVKLKWRRRERDTKSLFKVTSETV